MSGKSLVLGRFLGILNVFVFFSQGAGQGESALFSDDDSDGGGESSHPEDDDDEESEGEVRRKQD